MPHSSHLVSLPPPPPSLPLSLSSLFTSLSLSLSLFLFFSLCLSLLLSPFFFFFSVACSVSFSISVSLSNSFSVSVSVSPSLSRSLPLFALQRHVPPELPLISPWFPLDFPFMSFSCIGFFGGCPRHVPFHSFQFPLHVRVIFSVCPLHCPCMSLSFIASHFPTSPFESFDFLVLCLPCSPPSLPCFSCLSPSCPFQFPFVSLSVPLCFPFISPCFPVMSTSRPLHACISLYFLHSFPCTSLHFPFAPRYFPVKNNTCFPRFRKKDVKQHRVFQYFRGRKPEPAKSRQGDSSLQPLLCDTGSPKTIFSGTSSGYRTVRG